MDWLPITLAEAEDFATALGSLSIFAVAWYLWGRLSGGPRSPHRRWKGTGEAHGHDAWCDGAARTSHQARNRPDAIAIGPAKLFTGAAARARRSLTPATQTAKPAYAGPAHRPTDVSRPDRYSRRNRVIGGVALLARLARPRPPAGLGARRGDRGGRTAHPEYRAARNRMLARKTPHPAQFRADCELSESRPYWFVHNLA